jgi:hypothetical protein
MSFPAVLVRREGGCIREPTNRDHTSFRARRNSMTPTTTNPDKELAHRTGDGIDVSLYWNERTNQVIVKVYDARSDEGFQFDVDGRRALDAYRHPFAYAGREQIGEKMVATGKLAA